MTPHDKLLTAMMNNDKPSGPDGSGWNAGDQLVALRFYLEPEVVIITQDKEDAGESAGVGKLHKGNCLAILQHGRDYFLWRDDFGSCYGCDVLGGGAKHNGFDYIQRTLSIGNTRWFTSLEDVVDFCRAPDAEALLWSEKNFDGLLEHLAQAA